MKLSNLSECKTEVLALNGKSQQDLDEDIAILKEWIRKEAHLPRSLLEDTNFLEINLIRNKFSIERTKQKLENYCTLKGQHLFLYDFFIEGMLPFEGEQGFFYTMDTLTDDFARIAIYRIDDEDKIDMDKEGSSCIMLRELTSRWDYSATDICIIDLSQCTMQSLMKMKINRVVPMNYILLSALSGRVKAIHIINDKWITPFVKFFKFVVPGKLSDRIHAHTTYETLQEHIPKQFLPKDYGGDQRSFKEIRADWEIIFKENTEAIKACIYIISNEELRTGSTGEGLQGTFRKLVID